MVVNSFLCDMVMIVTCTSSARHGTWYRVVIKMASFIQSHLQKIKPSAKNVIEKYKEVFEQAQKELKTPEQLRQGLETFLAASKKTT